MARKHLSFKSLHEICIIRSLTNLLCLAAFAISVGCGCINREALPASSCILAPAEGLDTNTLVLAGPGVEPCPIVFQNKKSSQEAVNAAVLLAEKLSKITGAKFQFREAVPGEPLPERAILVGDFGTPRPGGLRRDGFIVRTDGKRLHITGNSDIAHNFAATAFLEMLGCRWWSQTEEPGGTGGNAAVDALGCKWWSGSEEEMPSLPNLAICEVDRVVNPPFSLHDLYNVEAQRVFWRKSRCRSSVEFTGGHTLYPLLKAYASTHPEIAPMDAKGQRRLNDLHFCYLSDGISEALAEALEQEVQKRGGKVDGVVYFAGMGDWYGGMCECPPCKAAYEEEAWTNPDGERKPGYSATLLRMINRTAELMEKRHPGIVLGTFAYMSLENPPAKTVPRENVVIWMPHLRHCIIHGIDQCGKNRSFYLSLRRWCEIAPERVYIWDYGVGYGDNFLYPFPVLRSMARNIRLFGKIGVAGDMIQGNYVSYGGDLVVLKNYVWRKLMWDPSLETDALVREFCAGYYGPAAEKLAEYVMSIEDLVANPEAFHLDEFVSRDGMAKTYMGDDARARLRQILSEALDATDGKEPYARRVREALASLDAFEVWVDFPWKEDEAPLAERDGWLVRTDLGGENIWPRALDLIRYSRGASPREWGSGHAYRRWLFKLAGGPVHTLSRDGLAVKVAPIQDGQIRSVVFSGQELLSTRETPRARRKDSPAPPKIPGLQERFSSLKLGEEYYIYTVDGNPAPGRVEMSCEAGIDHWSSDAKQFFRKVVELPEPGLLRITTAVRQGNRDPKYSSSAAEPSADYLAGSDPARFTLELCRQGAWEKVAVAEGLAGLAGVTAYRLSLPDKGCVIEERLDRASSDGRIGFHKGDGVLSIRLSMPEVQIPAGAETVNCVRELRISAMPR